MKPRLRHVALGAAAWGAWRGIREEGKPNWGPDVAFILKNAGIEFPAPWCAAYLQGITDAAAKALGVPNPLDNVLREGLVADYAAWADAMGGLRAEPVDAGDLVLYAFGGQRWNHIGIVVSPPKSLVSGSEFSAIEGNTDSKGGREGVEVALKRRRYSPTIVRFVRWDEGAGIS